VFPHFQENDHESPRIPQKPPPHFSAATMLGGYVAHAAEQKTYRVGLIGCGWYGKSDLWRLIQVSPVEVVSLCDVDTQQTLRRGGHGAEAAEVAEAAAHVCGLPGDAQRKGPRHRAGRVRRTIGIRSR